MTSSWSSFSCLKSLSPGFCISIKVWTQYHFAVLMTEGLTHILVQILLWGSWRHVFVPFISSNMCEMNTCIAGNFYFVCWFNLILEGRTWLSLFYNLFRSLATSIPLSHSLINYASTTRSDSPLPDETLSWAVMTYFQFPIADSGTILPESGLTWFKWPSSAHHSLPCRLGKGQWTTLRLREKQWRTRQRVLSFLLCINERGRSIAWTLTNIIHGMCHMEKWAKIHALQPRCSHTCVTC